jgi:hypothetical protein
MKARDAIPTGGDRHDPRQPSLAMSDIESVVPPGTAFILVDDGELPSDGFSDRRVLRFRGRGAGSPAGSDDDRTSVEELHRLRRQGAGHIVFAGTAHLLFERSAGLGRYLRSHFPCLFRDDRIIAFGLGGYSKEALFHACAPRGGAGLLDPLARNPCVSA